MDAEAIASLTTAAGTLVLAVATFGATRSANRSSKIAERSLLAGIRPLLVNSQPGDPEQKIGFGDGHWVHAGGGRAVVEDDGENIYLVISVRNVGSGIGVLQSWSVIPTRAMADRGHDDPDDFRTQQRDFYIAAGGLGLWQGRVREPDDPVREELRAAIAKREIFTLDLLYTDVHGGQRTISRFSMQPVGDDAWMPAVIRHWMLDGASAR
jgi:hypothetical protein